MRHLNYNHLLYFWTVAREGSIAKATEVLHLTPQTISVQLKILEESVGEPLFSRAGRGLVLTEFGHLVFQYADEIFSIGEELCVRLKSKDASMAPSLQVGITNSIPKLIAMRILQPALEGDEPIKLICKEGSLESLLGGLAVHQLDMIISDCAIPAGLNVKAYSHALGNSDIGFFAKTTNARRYIKDFPRSLNNAPLLLPTTGNPIRSGLEVWLDSHDISPTLVAEFEDSALMKAFGEEGLGVFPSPEVIQDEIETMYKCRMLGKADSVREYYYAISPERKLKHPIVLEIIEAARDNLFGS
ncbi:MAG: transcriptional activator NhaR [Proteobacteria bacterium]|nr:transcriptional activator NhaR [Pseudomonadota bacterium]MDA0927897.1 transcriptional activator NhaR [Pseudomonadota bacterium]